MNPGELFERTFETPEGDIDLLAEVAVEGSTLILRDVAVYPVAPGRLDIGTASVLRMRDQLAAEAAAMGFTALRLTAMRVSGAAPGKQIDLTIDLTRYRR